MYRNRHPTQRETPVPGSPTVYISRQDMQPGDVVEATRTNRALQIAGEVKQENVDLDAFIMKMMEVKIVRTYIS